jgi:hypothetical protein
MQLRPRSTPAQAGRLGRERPSATIGQVDKWNLCLTSARMPQGYLYQVSARLWPFHAAQHGVLIRLLIIVSGIFMRSGRPRDISKLGRLRSSRRTAAIALLKVGRGFRYQLAARWVGAAPACSSCDHTVISGLARRFSVILRLLLPLPAG